MKVTDFNEACNAQTLGTEVGNLIWPWIYIHICVCYVALYKQSVCNKQTPNKKPIRCRGYNVSEVILRKQKRRRN
jgi:hypothetical protein